jgi:Na+/H+ antiporter NhaD/arsenite permease-like protein
MTPALIWMVTGGTIACVLIRPKGWPEAVWACLGAALLVVCGLIPVSRAASAVAKGLDVYLFLTGMMLLADLARHEGVFDWLAGIAVRAAKGSASRLFGLVYAVGIVVTVFLSNDATAVVLTPAVYAALKKARADARPYLFACAFIANAASFSLPISNPANLVVYGKNLPPLLEWLRIFAFPSAISIGVTFLVLRRLFRNCGPEAGAPRGALWRRGEFWWPRPVSDWNWGCPPAWRQQVRFCWRHGPTAGQSGGLSARFRGVCSLWWPVCLCWWRGWKWRARERR